MRLLFRTDSRLREALSVALAVSAVFLGTCGYRGNAVAPAAQAVEGAEKARVAGYEFTLRGKELSYSGALGDDVLKLEEQAPCHLHRDDDGNVRSMKVNGATVFLIECFLEKKASVDGSRRLCDTTLRGVVIRERGVTLPDKGQTVGACPPFQWDQKMFAFFAE